MLELDCITWNLHRCRGRDAQIDPDRTVRVLCDLLSDAAPGLCILTEADDEQPPYGALLDLDRIQEVSGLATAHTDLSLRWGDSSHGFLGTIVLHDPRVEIVDGCLLDLPGVYPRGATILTCRAAGHDFRVIATHLSLGQPLRVAQMRAVGQYLARHRDLPALLIGDLNEWRPWGGFAFSRGVAHRSFTGPARRSYPAVFPMLPLDRIMATAPFRVENAHVLRSPELVETSDHLPLRATVTLA